MTRLPHWPWTRNCNFHLVFFSWHIVQEQKQPSIPLLSLHFETKWGSKPKHNVEPLARPVFWQGFSSSQQVSQMYFNQMDKQENPRWRECFFDFSNTCKVKACRAMRKVSCFECSSSPNVSVAFSCDISTRTSETGKLGFVRNTGAYVQQMPSKETKKLSSAFHSLQFLNSRIYRRHISCRREQRSVLIFVDGEKKTFG